MSTQADQADLYWCLRGEKDLEFSAGREPATPPATPDHACLDHVGAHLKCRKESCPNYPSSVDFSEDEASAQPDRKMSRGRVSTRLQHSPERSLQHSPLTPELTPTQKGPYMTRSEYEHFEHHASTKHKRGSISSRTGRAFERTPIQSREPSPGTSMGHNEYTNNRFLHPDEIPDYLHEYGTPSHRSFASDQNEIERNDIEPFTPQARFGQDLYSTPPNNDIEWTISRIWDQKE